MKKKINHIISVVLFFALMFTIIIAVGVGAQEIPIPKFWSVNESSIKKIDFGNKSLNFVTTTGFPPFSYIDQNKNLSGFNVDLARAVCLELVMKNACSIQALPWSELESALAEGKSNAIISGLAISPATRKRLAFTRSYLAIPARFIARRQNQITEPLYRSLRGKTVGVVNKTAHESYLKSNFGGVNIRVFLDQITALESLSNGKIDAVFSDAITLSVWLHSEGSGDCCQFVGGPYISPKYFGAGFSIAVDPKNKDLLIALNYALRSISDKGIFSELYLRYFPVGLF